MIFKPLYAWVSDCQFLEQQAHAKSPVLPMEISGS